MADVQWLSPAEMRAWLAYVAASSLLEGALDRQLQRDSGIPHAYYQILAILAQTPEHSLRMGALASLTQSSQSRLSHAVSRLEGKGWVRREPCPDDGRSTFARLTEAGGAALAEAAPGHVAAVRKHLIDRLSSEQVEQLEAICALVVEGIEQEPPPER
jgi:DNA-binding MarR family transcriptional regulator